MAFQVSPGVRVTETDLTTVVPAVSTSIGAFAGPFTWGPVNEIVTIGNENQLAEVFGKPVAGNAAYFFTAAQFLQYGNTLKVVRAEITGAVNSVSGGSTFVAINNREDYDSETSLTQPFYAKYPGLLGNSLKVSVCPANISDSMSAFNNWQYRNLFDTAPGTSDHAAEIVGDDVRDELHVVVVDEDGLFTGTPNTVLETFAYVSQAPDAKNSDGSTNYTIDVINNQSQYIWCGKSIYSISDASEVNFSEQLHLRSAGTNPDQVLAFGISLETLASRSTTAPEYRKYHTYALDPENTTAGSTKSLSGGKNNASDSGQFVANSAISSSNFTKAYDWFKDKETEEVNLIIGGVISSDIPKIASVTEHTHLVNLVEGRKDCLVFLSPPEKATVNPTTTSAVENVKHWADKIVSTSYAVLDSTALYVYDKYNDAYVWIPANGAVAGLCANTDRVADAWYSPAGYDRGQLRGITKLAFNPSETDRDKLYKARVNPIVSFPGAGIILYGDKTALKRPSAFDRINVRRLFNILKTAIAEAAKAQLFEFNDEFTRAQFRNLIEPFLRDIRGRRGIEDFHVQCDEQNNPPSVVDTNRFVADIYVDPPNSINFITLNFVATRTGVDFNEIIGNRN